MTKALKSAGAILKDTRDASESISMLVRLRNGLGLATIQIDLGL